MWDNSLQKKNTKKKKKEKTNGTVKKHEKKKKKRLSLWFAEESKVEVENSRHRGGASLKRRGGETNRFVRTKI